MEWAFCFCLEQDRLTSSTILHREDELLASLVYMSISFCVDCDELENSCTTSPQGSTHSYLVDSLFPKKGRSFYMPTFESPKLTTRTARVFLKVGL